MKIIILTLSVLFVTVEMSAQPAPPISPAGGGGGNLFGIVIDQLTNRPVEFATIGLYSSNDSSLVTGTITDDEGNFKIEQVPFGDYYLDVRFMGYTNKRITEINLSKEQKKLSIGPVTLQQSSTELEGVEIVAEQAAVEYKIDRKVINVGQNVAAAGGTALDVLENSPSIQTDANGDILVRGSSSFTVLIDGKPSVLEGNDALRQMPASNIQSVEIITNPSAKYDPDGTAGIINLVTKKNRTNGLTGIINASMFNTREYSTDVQLNYKLNRFNLFGGIELNDRPSPGTLDSYRETYIGDTARVISSEGDWTWRRGGQRFKFGGDYHITDNSTLSLTGSLGQRQFGYKNTGNFKEFRIPASMEEFYWQDMSFNTGGNYYSLNLNYQQKFNDKGHELSANIDYSGQNGDEWNEAYERTTDQNWNPVDADPGRLRANELSESDDIRYKLDYTLPVGEKSKFEAGYQGKLESRGSDYVWEAFDPDLLVWAKNADQSSELDYSISNQGGYLIFSNQNNIVDFQGGMRAEYTDRIITQLSLDEEYRVHRLDFFPSFSMSKKFGNEHQLQASYSRRINRPRSWNLDPIATYIDPQRIRQGNPLLEPEFIDSYELNYIKSFGQNFFSIETYYRKTNNKIEWVNEVNADNIMVMTFANLANDYSIGSEVSGNVNVFKWWTVMTGVNVFNYQVDARNIGGELRNANTWNMRLNNTIKLKYDTRIQFSGFYNGKSVSAQGEQKGFLMTNLGIRQDLLDRKLSVTLNVRDLFGTMRFESISEGSNFYAVNKFGRQARVFGLSVSYSLNDFKQDRRASDGMDVDMGGGGF